MYMNLASLVKRSAPGGRVMCWSECFSAKESLKCEGWADATGLSIWSTHLPRLWGMLLGSEHTGRVGHRLFAIPLCTM